MESKDLTERERALVKEMRGSADPLRPRLELALSLEEGGGEARSRLRHRVLQETLDRYAKDPRYSSDPRIVLLVHMFSKSGDDDDVVSSTTVLSELGHYRDVNEIFTNVLRDRRSQRIADTYREFLAMIGHKYLMGELPCTKCKVPSISAVGDAAKENLQEENQLQSEDVDENFDCPIAYFEPFDPTKIPCYCKYKVYRGEEEFQLEQLRAELYLSRIKNEPPKTETVEDQRIAGSRLENRPSGFSVENRASACNDENRASACNDENRTSTCNDENRMSACNDENRMSACNDENRMSACNDENRMSACNDENRMSACNDENRMSACNDENRVSACNNENRLSSISVENKQLASNVDKKLTVVEKSLNRCPLPPSPALFPQLCQDTSAVNHQSFTVHTKEAMNVVQEMWNSPTPHDYRSPVFKVPEAPPPLAKKHLPFQVFSDLDSPPKEKAKEERTVVERAVDRDLSDETCNTNVFNIEMGIPTSTPFGQKKRLTRDSSKPLNNDGSYISEECLKNTITGTKEDLSVILETSLEKCQSSGNDGPLKTPHRPLVQEVELGMECLGIREDPFSSRVTQSLLARINFPLAHHKRGYHVVSSNIPNATKVMKLEGESYTVLGELGRGAYARVIKAVSVERKSVCALKMEKPPCVWEFYIVRELLHRLHPSKVMGIMGVHEAFIYNNGSILKTDWAAYGNLLDVVNTVKKSQSKQMELGILLSFSLQLMQIVESVHACGIIHGDIKPDNFVLRALPDSMGKEPWIQLIDFGRSIDMTLLPPGTQFTAVINTNGFTCTEMKENRPWTFQSDLYGLAGTIHLLLVGDYMNVVKKSNTWVVQKTIARNLKRELWEGVFRTLLNVESCDKQPDLTALGASLRRELDSIERFYLHHSFSSLNNVLLGK